MAITWRIESTGLRLARQRMVAVLFTRHCQANLPFFWLETKGNHTLYSHELFQAVVLLYAEFQNPGEEVCHKSEASGIAAFSQPMWNPKGSTVKE